MIGYVISYFVIGIIFGLATTFNVWSQYINADPMSKAMAHIDGYGWWQTYAFIFITRCLGWPVYLVMRFMA